MCISYLRLRWWHWSCYGCPTSAMPHTSRQQQQQNIDGIARERCCNGVQQQCKWQDACSGATVQLRRGLTAFGPNHFDFGHFENAQQPVGLQFVVLGVDVVADGLQYRSAFILKEEVISGEMSDLLLGSVNYVCLSVGFI